MDSKIQITFYLLLFLVIYCCESLVTDTDKKLLNELKEKYRDKYKFELKYDLYLFVTFKNTNNGNDIEDIYRYFFLRNDKLREESSYIYLNVYNTDEKFLYQLYFYEGKIIRSNIETYS